MTVGQMQVPKQRNDMFRSHDFLLKTLNRKVQKRKQQASLFFTLAEHSSWWRRLLSREHSDWLLLIQNESNQSAASSNPGARPAVLLHYCGSQRRPVASTKKPLKENLEETGNGMDSNGFAMPFP